MIVLKSNTTVFKYTTRYSQIPIYSLFPALPEPVSRTGRFRAAKNQGYISDKWPSVSDNSYPVVDRVDFENSPSIVVGHWYKEWCAACEINHKQPPQPHLAGYRGSWCSISYTHSYIQYIPGTWIVYPVPYGTQRRKANDINALILCIIYYNIGQGTNSSQISQISYIFYSVTCNVTSQLYMCNV